MTKYGSAQAVSTQLEAAFNTILTERMADIPIVNPSLDVAAIGFCEYENNWLGVMITPWFLNLMLLPGDGEDWSSLQTGETQLHSFPSGRYQFITGYEASIGHYQSCSLFSPMFEFADQQAAIETAEAICIELMNEEHVDAGDIKQSEITSIWQGDNQHDDLAESIENEANEAAEYQSADHSEVRADTHCDQQTAPLQRTISRADLLRGRFRGSA